AQYHRAAAVAETGPGRTARLRGLTRCRKGPGVPPRQHHAAGQHGVVAVTRTETGGRHRRFPHHPLIRWAGWS
ncbi:hypothetical protein B8W90_13840, partial [Staphylococcus hominis]